MSAAYKHPAQKFFTYVNEPGDKWQCTLCPELIKYRTAEILKKIGQDRNPDGSKRSADSV